MLFVPHPAGSNSTAAAGLVRRPPPLAAALPLSAPWRASLSLVYGGLIERQGGVITRHHASITGGVSRINAPSETSPGLHLDFTWASPGQRLAHRVFHLGLVSLTESGAREPGSLPPCSDDTRDAGKDETNNCNRVSVVFKQTTQPSCDPRPRLCVVFAQAKQDEMVQVCLVTGQSFHLALHCISDQS